MSTGDWLPYIALKNHPSKGYVIEIAEIIFNNAGHTLITSNVPYPRALQQIETGEIDLLPCFAIGDMDSKDVLLADEEIGINQQVFLTQVKNTWHYHNANSLTHLKTLGLVKGETYSNISEYISNKYNKTKISWLHGEDAYNRLLQMLHLGRVEAIIENQVVASYYAFELGLSHKIKNAGLIGEKRKLWMAFSPKNTKAKQYAALLSNGIKKLRHSGALTKILKKYGVQDWK